MIHFVRPETASRQVSLRSGQLEAIRYVLPTGHRASAKYDLTYQRRFSFPFKLEALLLSTCEKTTIQQYQPICCARGSFNAIQTLYVLWQRLTYSRVCAKWIFAAVCQTI